MTRNELQLREKAVVMAYKVGNRNAAANYIMELYHRNVYSTNHIYVATSKMACFAHYMGH